MLSLNQASRRRLAAGAACTSLLIAAGLGLTASGSATAAAIKTSVADTIGVDLSQADLPPPPPPPVSGERPVPPVPPVAPVPGKFDRSNDVTTVTTDDGKMARKRVIRIKNGKVEDADWQGLVDMPQVSSINCDKNGEGGLVADQMVVRKTSDGKKMVVICSDRIARKSADGAELAANSADIERHAMASARDSLRTARAAIEGNRNLSDSQRQEALSGLDEAQAEIDADVARGE